MKIFVGSLPFSAEESDLRNSFEKYGEVSSVNIIMDKFSGRSRGFGFVEMPDAAAGNQAIEAMNGRNLGGRPLVVNEARPREERPRQDRGPRY